MSALLDARYALPATVAPYRLVPASDELLGRPVEVLVLDAVPDELARERLLRRLRRATLQPDRWLAPVLDTGSTGPRPFLVVPPTPRGTLADAPPLPPEPIVGLALQTIDATLALRRRGLAPAPLLPELVRMGPEGTVQLVATGPWPPEPAEGAPATATDAAADGAGDPGVRQVAGLVARLLERYVQQGQGAQTSGLARLQAIVGRALGMSGPPLRELPALREELMGWQDARVLESSARSAPTPAAPTAPAGPTGPEPATVVLPAVRPATESRPVAPVASGATARPLRQPVGEPPIPSGAEPPTQPGGGPPTSTATPAESPAVEPAAAAPARSAATEAATEGIPRVTGATASTAPAPDPGPETAYVPLSSLLGDGRSSADQAGRQSPGALGGLRRWLRQPQPPPDDATDER